MDEKLQNELEAAVFRRLVAHLRVRSDVQNIDLMELAGFCRNCLSNWYQEAAAERGLSVNERRRATRRGAPAGSVPSSARDLAAAGPS